MDWHRKKCYSTHFGENFKEIVHQGSQCKYASSKRLLLCLHLQQHHCQAWDIKQQYLWQQHPPFPLVPSY
eukprot:12151684-Ditylum_brightwellii.AAC.1